MKTFTTIYSEEDRQWVGRCDEYPLLSWLDKDRNRALLGIIKLVAETEEDERQASQGRTFGSKR